MLHQLLISSGLLLATAAGLAGWRRLSAVLRIVALQCLAAQLFTIAAVAIIKMKIDSTNHHLLNISLIAECGLLLLALHNYFNRRLISRWLAAGFAVFLLTWVWSVCIYKLRIFATGAALTESLLLMSAFLYTLYHSVMRQRSLHRNAIVWLSLGAIVYFGPLIPYISLMSYLQKTYPVLNSKLFYVVPILANLRYLLTAIGFATGIRQGNKRVAAHDLT